MSALCDCRIGFGQNANGIVFLRHYHVVLKILTPTDDIWLDGNPMFSIEYIHPDEYDIQLEVDWRAVARELVKEEL